MPSYYRDPDAPAPNVPRRAGVIAVVERNGRVLLQRRADDGAWDFIGGQLDEEETVRDALARELREETGLEIEEADLLGVFSDPSRIIEYPDGDICRLLSVVFVVRPAPGEPRPSEESLELRFVDRDELERSELWPSVLPVRDAYLASPDAAVVE